MQIMLVATGMADGDIRREAFTGLAMMLHLIGDPTQKDQESGPKWTIDKKFREVPQVWSLLAAFRNAIPEENAVIPPYIGHFLASSLAVMMKPDHESYALVCSWFANKKLVLSALPLMERLLNTGDEAFKTNRVWSLRLLRRTAMSNSQEAWKSFQKMHVVQQVMGLADAPYIDFFVWRDAITTLHALRSVSHQLVRDFDILRWIGKQTQAGARFGTYQPLHAMQLTKFAAVLIQSSLLLGGSPDTDATNINQSVMQLLKSQDGKADGWMIVHTFCNFFHCIEALIDISPDHRQLMWQLTVTVARAVATLWSKRAVGLTPIAACLDKVLVKLNKNNDILDLPVDPEALWDKAWQPAPLLEVSWIAQVAPHSPTAMALLKQVCRDREEMSQVEERSLLQVLLRSPLSEVADLPFQAKMQWRAWLAACHQLGSAPADLPSPTDFEKEFSAEQEEEFRVTTSAQFRRLTGQDSS